MFIRLVSKVLLAIAFAAAVFALINVLYFIREVLGIDRPPHTAVHFALLFLVSSVVCVLSFVLCVATNEYERATKLSSRTSVDTTG